jgi:hypothetical protein
MFLNLWQGPEDSLRHRWERAERLIQRLPSLATAVYIVSYSVGCHLAIQFARRLAELHRPIVRQLYLFAPDPKYRKVEWDRRDQDLNRRSAYEEAIEFWEYCNRPKGPTLEIPGKSLEHALRSVLASKIHTQIICCEQDPVSEWKRNVQQLREEFPDSKRVHWDLAKVGESLFPAGGGSEDWIHSQILDNLFPPILRQLTDY